LILASVSAYIPTFIPKETNNKELKKIDSIELLQFVSPPEFLTPIT
jgi:hypothetical protein